MKVLIILLLLGLLGIVQSQPGSPTQLKIEYRDSPVLGIDVQNPRFSWELQHVSRGQKQTAYQILVSNSSSVTSGDVWDSNKVTSGKSTQITYGGKTLKSDTSYYWKVRWWDSMGNPSPYSYVARFNTGLFNATDWTGKWIGGFNQLRKEFSIAEEVVSARLFIVGLGYYEARINGFKVGDYVLGTFTTFEKTILYDVYDVTDMLSWSNAIAVSLGNGWYSQVSAGSKSLLVQLNIQLTSGKTFSVVSDTTWKGIQGPITNDDIYIGETYDARLETPGWDKPNFNDTTWSLATSVNTPSGTLSAQLIQPIKEIDEYTPVSISEPISGTFVFDFGQNVAGYCRLEVSGPRGSKVVLEHSEMLYPDGTIQRLYSNSPMIDTYILKGEGVEVYKPKFTYHGFQYVSVTGFPGVPNLDSLRSYFVHSALPETGEIVFSNQLLNQIQHITRFASLSNYMNIPTDCPQRERRGWLGDAQLSAETTIHNWDMSAAYTKFIHDIRDEQEFDNKNGDVGDCAPFYGHGGIPADPAWGTAYTLLWAWMYQYYEDITILKQYYDGVKAYLQSLIDMTDKKTGLLTFSRYGDWCSIARDNNCAYPSAVVSSFYYLLELEAFANVAQLLGNTDDYTMYSGLAAKVRAVWNSVFYNSQTHAYEFGYQTQQVLSLYLNVVPESERNNVIQYLLNDIKKNNMHLTTGIVGIKYLLPVLSSIGRTDLAYTIATQSDYPSWGWMIKNGATTLWENWQGDRYTTYGSRNHIMFGSQSDWYYKVLGGINLVSNTTGWTNIQYKPDINSLIDSDLTSVSASIRTHRGLVESVWRRNKALCATAAENSAIQITCLTGTISSIEFASYGLPTGSCGNFTVNPSCNSQNSVSIVSKECIGKSSCSVDANNSVFGGDPCLDIVKHLYVQVGGCSYPSLTYQIQVPVGSDGEVYIPKLGHSTFIITEGTSIVWQDAHFVPGVSGITSGTDVGDSIKLTVGSGSYSFVLFIS